MQINHQWNRFADFLYKISTGRTPFSNILIKAIYFSVIVLVTPFLLSTDDATRYTDVQIGSVATKKVVAPFNFFILKTDEELKRDRQNAAKDIPYYFRYNDDSTLTQIRILLDTFEYLENSLTKKPEDTLQYYRNISDQLERRFRIKLNRSDLQRIREILIKPSEKRELNQNIKQIRLKILDGILDMKIQEIPRENIAIVRDNIEEKLNKSAKNDLQTFFSFVETELNIAFTESQSLAILKILKNIIQPNYIFDKKLTEAEEQAAVNSVSLTKEMVYENERIVDANERIDEEIYQKLYSLEMARVEKSKREGNWQAILAEIGRVMLLMSIMFIIGLYLYSFRKKIFNDNIKLLLIVVVLLLQIIIAAIISGPLDWPVYVIPTTLSSMLLAILIDSGIGFVGTVAVGLILGGILGGGVDITLMTIVSGMVAVYSVHEIRNRNQIFTAILYIGIAYIWIIAAITFVRFDSLNNLIKIFTYNLLPNAIFAPFFTYMILNAFERTFDITTNVRLLELSDLNHPLLKELSLKAPGTFHHSMVVGNLAEAAAKEIGENSLLVRVGSYFHDIGKMEKPEYFVENLMDATNRHNKLKPNMSALILVSHVKSGLEMAKEHNIPRLIRDFIAEHHGTSLMYYFYHKAAEQEGGKERVNEQDFRYPGPKPRSKATAIVMLADTVEAATRSLNNPSPPKIKSFVEDLIEKKFSDGELNECDLTFKELTQIKEAFLPVLYGVFQHRVEYPGQNEKNKSIKNDQTKLVNENKAN